MITTRMPSSYRIKGLGQTETGIGPGTLNCPGDPQCFVPGGLAWTPTPPVGDLSFWGTMAGQITGQQLAANPPATPSSPAGSFFLAYQPYILWGVGLLVLFSFMSEGRR